VQTFDLFVQVFKTLVIDNNVIRQRKAFFPARLGGKDGINLARGSRVSCGNPPVLQLLRCINDQDTVQGIVQCGFHQQWDNQDAIGRLGLIGQRHGPFTDAGVENALQLLALFWIGENSLAKLTAIQPATCIDELSTECRADFRQRGLAGLHQFTGDEIGIDNGRAQARETVGCFCLPLPIPPVRPIRSAVLISAGHAGPAQIGAGNLLTPQQGDPAGNGQVRSEGDRLGTVPSLDGEHGTAEYSTDS